MADLKSDLHRYMDAVTTRVDAVDMRRTADARPSPRSRLLLVVGAAVVAALAGVAAVAWPENDREQVSVEPARTFELPDGFAVVDGSELVGPAIPPGTAGTYNGAPLIDGGFVALLEVRGNPVDVIGAYLDQAATQGMTIHHPIDATETAEGQPAVRCQDVDGAFTCAAYARNGDPQEPRSVAMRFSRGQVGDARPTSHLELRYSTVALYWESGNPLASGTSDLTPPQVPDSITPSPDDARMFEGADPMRPVSVMEGSHLVADMAFPLLNVAEAVALVEVTEKGDDVLQRYITELGNLTGERTETRPPLDVRGGRLTQSVTSEAGGDSYDLAFYDTDRQGTWILIRASHD